MTRPKRLLAIVRLGRPHFLAGGFLFYGLGVIMARQTGVPLNLSVLLWGQAAVTCTQLMTHYANEYFDLAADRANPTPTAWSGGSRVLPQGLVAPRVALIAALLCAAGAVLAMAVLSLFLRPQFLTPLLLATALALAWFYSAPPLRLHSRGLGEASVALLVPGLTPLLGYYLQAGGLAWMPVLAVIPLCCLQFAMLLGIEFPDAAGDSLIGKKTLVVRLGAGRAARLVQLALPAAYLLLPVLWLAGLPWPVAVAGTLMLPLALWQMRRFQRGDWRRPACWNGLAFTGVVLLMGTAGLQFLAWLRVANILQIGR